MNVFCSATLVIYYCGQEITLYLQLIATAVPSLFCSIPQSSVEGLDCLLSSQSPWKWVTNVSAGCTSQSPSPPQTQPCSLPGTRGGRGSRPSWREVPGKLQAGRAQLLTLVVTGRQSQPHEFWEGCPLIQAITEEYITPAASLLHLCPAQIRPFLWPIINLSLFQTLRPQLLLCHSFDTINKTDIAR